MAETTENISQIETKRNFVPHDAEGRKSAVTADFDEIPDELKCLRQWVTWRPQPRSDGKIDKIPVDPRTGENASVSEPKTWGAFQDIARCARKGFVFTKDDPFVGVDLDSCRDPETGDLTEWARDVMRRFPNWYWEISPSGKGVHGIGRGKLPPGRPQARTY